MPSGFAFTLCAAAALAGLFVFAEGPRGNSVEQKGSSATPTGTAASAKFAELSEKFMKDSLVLSPVSASQAGYHTYADAKTGKTIALDSLLDDLSAEGIARQRAFYGEWRDRFRAETPVATLAPEDAADWQLIDDQIGLNLLEFDKIQSYKHNPTVAVELIGNGLFLPLTQSYAPLETRLGQVLDRVAAIPHFLTQVQPYIADCDPVWISTAVEENEGNIDLIQTTLAEQIPAGSELKTRYDQVTPAAITSLKSYSDYLQNVVAKRAKTGTWRLGEPLYDEKFRLVMETPVTPEQVLADAEQELKDVRAEMFQLALPMYQRMNSGAAAPSGMSEHDWQSKVIGDVLMKISDEHPQRDQLMATIQADLAGITQFIRDKKIVSLGPRDNLKVVPTPVFMRGIYSVAGFHSAPPLDPNSEAEYWVTPIDPQMSAAKAESKLREYNNYALQWLSIHEALPGHYVQFEHVNNIQPERRRLLRSLYGNGAYVEGWAEYIAQVMMDEGFLNNSPEFRMVMRKIRLRVIANAILDIKMHTMDMSDREALDLMTKESFQTQAEAEGKLKRAKLSSTQLPTYYVGIREWLALRKSYQAAAGANFDMLKFHDMVLDEGPLPVPVVEKLVMPSATK
jgi:uncharacterized protein (DUF885 family)